MTPFARRSPCHSGILCCGLALLVSATAARAAAAGTAASASPVVATAAAATSADPLVERGRYLALAADCSSCHTSPGGAPYTGGAAIVSKFGNLFAPNITPDPKTGIGEWTEHDFEGALRRGVGKDGERLYPAMPYTNYTKISDDDVHALWAYFRSVQPVSQASQPNALRFPFSVRAGMSVWQSVFFEPGRFSPTAAKDAAWNRGAYLVEALGHCDACHSPRNIAQASDAKRHLTGAQIEGWYAPDISSDPLSTVAKRSVDGLAKVLKGEPSRRNDKAFGPMSLVVHDSLAKLTDADLRAMAVYLKDQPPVAKPQRVADRKPLPAGALAAGQAVYEANCSSCHQPDGKGMAKTAPALAGDTGVAATEPYNVMMAVLQGFDPQDTWGAMPAYANVLTDQQIADVTNYVRNSWGNRGERPTSAWSVSHLRDAAKPPAAGERAGLICPSLPIDEVQPASAVGAAALKRSATDRAALRRVVDGYLAARPGASSAQVIEALSTAYCTALATGGASTVRTGAAVADYSQQIATLLVGGGEAASPASRGAAKPAVH